MPSYRFESETVSRNEQAALATTNLITGIFHGPQKDSIRVFFASWEGEAGKNLSVVQHTPDICWVKAGWHPVDAGQPDKLEIFFGPIRLEFECRAFESPGGRARELVAWCTMVGGRPYEELWRFKPETAAPNHESWRQRGRMLAASQFWQSVRQRSPAERSKQFARYSTALSGNWQQAMETLRVFGPQWLELKQTKS